MSERSARKYVVPCHSAKPRSTSKAANYRELGTTIVSVTLITDGEVYFARDLQWLRLGLKIGNRFISAGFAEQSTVYAEVSRHRLLGMATLTNGLSHPRNV